MKIAYFVDGCNVCGGNRIIFEHCNRLADRGHEIFVIIKHWEYKRDWFVFNKKIRFIRVNESPKDLDILVATFWSTVYDIDSLKVEAKKFFYFVQSDERRFVDEILMKEEVEKTYRSSINIITVARWIQNMLKKEFNKESIFVGNKLNPKDFFVDPDKNLKSDKITVLVEGSCKTTKKGVYDAMDALDGLDVRKWLVTNSSCVLGKVNDIFDKIWSKPSQDRLRKIFSSADILMKVSWFEGNPLVQMESMACGTALITSDATGTDENCINEYNCLKVPVKDVKAIREAVRRLIEDKELREKLADNGLKYAKKYFDWKPSIDKLERTFKEILI